MAPPGRRPSHPFRDMTRNKRGINAPLPRNESMGGTVCPNPALPATVNLSLQRQPQSTQEASSQTCSVFSYFADRNLNQTRRTVGRVSLRTEEGKASNPSFAGRSSSITSARKKIYLTSTRKL